MGNKSDPRHPTIEYVFEHGITLIDIAIINQTVTHIAELHPDWELQIDSFHSRGQAYAAFTVSHKDYAEDALKQITIDYETRIKVLEAQREQLTEVISMLISKPQIGELIMGDKHIGRDNIEISGNARVEQFTTGASFQGDHAQQLLQSTTPQSSKEDIFKLLSFVQQELPKLPLPEEVKEEVANEVKGAEIQAKKEEPDKKKIGEKLQSATEALEKVPKLTKAAITVGNLLGQAIVWCGMKWVEWKYGG